MRNHAGLLSLILVLAIALPAFAGGAQEGAVKVDPTTLTGSELKIAVLLPSSPTDGGWGQVGASGLKVAAEAYGFEPVIIEARTADLMKVEAETLAQEGFNIIFGHGGQYASPFSEIAGMYPNTIFITAGGDIVSENQAVAEFVVERLTYIQGVMAGHLTKTKKVGTVVGGGYPSYTKTSRGFELGVKSVDPTIEVMFAITQNAADMNEGYELTLSQINAGADIVWANANQATQGSVAAARETDTYIFGTVMDIQQEAPEQAISTVAQFFNVLYTDAIKKYLDGELKGGILKLGVEEGGIKWIWNERVKSELPADVVGLYEELLPGIQSGEIYVPSESEGW